jgi:integrase
MARPEKLLSPRTVATVKDPGRHADGGGLFLNVSKTGSKSWVFMWKTAGKRTEIGLGSLSTVPLTAAREKALAAREALGAGKNPLDVLRANREVPTFGAVADDLLATMSTGWRNAKHGAQWRMTLREYAKPLRSRRVDQITTENVLECLKPHWTTKPETASRLRGRIEAVLSAATAKGHRTGQNPAQWRHHLDRLLPKRSRQSRGHHAALPFVDLPAFMQRLRGTGGLAAIALQLVILTACRTSEVLNAEWKEFDLAARVWTIPAGRMKAGKEHRIPLCDRAMTIVMQLAAAKRGSFLFPGARSGRPLSNMSLAMLLRRMKQADVTVHGFRSTFRDWAGETTAFPREVIEAALAHGLQDRTEAAYRRGDALEKRRALMTAWENYCEPKADNVVGLFRGA